MLSGGYVQLKTDWNIPLECGEFKDTNDEAVWVGILFATKQKLKKKNKIETLIGLVSVGGPIVRPEQLWDNPVSGTFPISLEPQALLKFRKYPKVDKNNSACGGGQWWSCWETYKATRV